MAWDMVIGLEVHAQLRTQSKLFSGASTTFGAPPNAQTCFIDAGLPGVLPVLNKEAVSMAVQLGIALNAHINNESVFERKNYFYPDLPKGYQISQFQKPIVSKGILSITLDDGQIKEVDITRAHLEEDAGKSLHEAHPTLTGIDLNRAGIALLEIVTEPCLYSAEEAIKYLKTLHQLVRFLGICDGNMQEGSFRCDVNLSLKPQGSKVLGTRTELKNLNSFRFIEKAIAYEYARHQDLLERGEKVLQETRLFDPSSQSTYSMRSKENENDYRYFPDPDLLPIKITPEYIAEVKKSMPDLPATIEHQLNHIPSLNKEDRHFILSSPEVYRFYKRIKAGTKATDKLIINWLKGPYSAALNEQGFTFDTLPVSDATMASFLDKIETKQLTTNQAKTLFPLLFSGVGTLEQLIEQQGIGQEANDAGLENMIEELLKQFPEQVSEYKAGKDKLWGFFVGQIMKQTKGQGNPEQIHALLKKYLSSG